MRSLSDKPDGVDKNVIQQLHQSLDHSVDNLSQQALSDIAQARARALAIGKSKQPTMSERAHAWQSKPWFNLALPVAIGASLMLVITINTIRFESIPELPLALMTSQIPTEDLAMLEDLEFLTWLAENESTVL